MTGGLLGEVERDPAQHLHGVLAAAHSARVFSAAAWAVGDGRETFTSGFIGTRAWPELPEAADGLIDTDPLDGTELFDLASVTKPLLAIAILALVERGMLSLETTVDEVIPSYRGRPAGTATVGHLLLHTSGLPGQVPLYRKHADRDALLRAIGELPLLTPPGTRVTYSSQGYILLGLLTETVTGRPLDEVLAALVAGPAGAQRLGFAPRAQLLPIVATERCSWRGRVVQGEVHDENAVVLGEPAGHAGLFGTLDDIAAIGRAMVRNLHETVLLAPTTLATMIRNATQGLNLARSYGWQNMDVERPVAGHLVGRASFGHTGFTGTSLVVDPEAGRWYVLLTNRVHPSREGDAIVRLRTRFHDIASTLHAA